MKFTLNNFNTNNFNDIISLLILISSIFFNSLSFIFIVLVLFDYLIDKERSSQKTIIIFNLIGLTILLSTLIYLIYEFNI